MKSVHSPSNMYKDSFDGLNQMSSNQYREGDLDELPRGIKLINYNLSYLINNKTNPLISDKGFY